MAPCADAQSVNRSYRSHVNAVHLLLLLTMFYFLCRCFTFSNFVRTSFLSETLNFVII